jgi:murein L,D-transpeptidase YcbB/YkuD
MKSFSYFVHDKIRNCESNLQQKQHMRQHTIYSLLTTVILCLLLLSCGGKKKIQPEIVSNPEQMDEKVTELMSDYISIAIQDKNLLNDSIVMNKPEEVELIYADKNNEPIWSSKQNWLRVGDTLLDFIRNAKQWGLFPENYHFKNLDSIRKLFIADSANKSSRKDASLWAASDILLTDALVQIFYDVKLGRLQNDSVMKRKDSLLTHEFVTKKLDSLLDWKSLHGVLRSMEPQHKGYFDLKAGIRKFLDSADFRNFTYVPFPYYDTVKFRSLLKQRLMEGNYFAADSSSSDTASLGVAIKRFQKSKKITADGKAGGETVRALNNNDNDKFYRIAISLDRYKMLPEKMPEKYVWVNLPSFHLKIIENDTVRMISKIVVGKPHTRTPVLTSSVYEMITYPKWTIPNSIVVKDIIPGMRRNKEYLAKKGYSLFDKKGEEISPDSVDWFKYTKGLPYNVVQGSGDANALGVMKFNFHNNYQVYMHDTNERYLFNQTTRTLSHGCVRVQEWSKMSGYFLSNDSLRYKNADSLDAMRDSVQVWLERKEKHAVPFKNKVAVFFRYFTCEGKNGSIIFYDDIYGEDGRLRAKYYTRK